MKPLEWHNKIEFLDSIQWKNKDPWVSDATFKMYIWNLYKKVIENKDTFEIGWRTFTFASKPFVLCSIFDSEEEAFNELCTLKAISNKIEDDPETWIHSPQTIFWYFTLDDNKWYLVFWFWRALEQDAISDWWYYWEIAHSENFLKTLDQQQTQEITELSEKYKTENIEDTQEDISDKTMDIL